MWFHTPWAQGPANSASTLIIYHASYCVVSSHVSILIYFRLHSQSFVIVCKSSSSVHLHHRGHQQHHQQHHDRPSSPRRYQQSPSYHLSLIFSSSSIFILILMFVCFMCYLISLLLSMQHLPSIIRMFRGIIIIIAQCHHRHTPGSLSSSCHCQHFISSFSMSMKHTRLKLPYAARRHCHSLSSVFIILILDVCLEE